MGNQNVKKVSKTIKKNNTSTRKTLRERKDIVKDFLTTDKSKDSFIKEKNISRRVLDYNLTKKHDLMALESDNSFLLEKMLLLNANTMKFTIFCQRKSIN